MRTTHIRHLVRLGMSVVAISAIALAVSSGSALASDASGWHLGSLNTSGQELANGQAAPAIDGIATFNWPTSGYVNLLTTNQKSQYGNLLGDLSTAPGLTANVTSTASNYMYNGSDQTIFPANVRFFFETSNAGGFDPNHYWWATWGTTGYSLLANGTATITMSFDPANWSNYNGQTGSSQSTGFEDALSHVTEIGLSFGGGNFFENGVTTTDGGSFTLNSFDLR